MERKKYIRIMFIGLISLVGFFQVFAGDYAGRIYEAYLTGNVGEWLLIMEQMEQTETDDSEHWLELIGYYYGFTGNLINNEQINEAKKYIKKGELLVDRILQKEPENPLALSYKGTFLAFKMSVNKIKAVILGPQSVKYINKAYSLDSEHYQIIADKANLLYYAPGVFGGNKKEALQLYKESIKRMEAYQLVKPNWFYLSLQTSLAGMYRERGEIEEARRIYLHLIEAEPRYTKVKERLLPSLGE